MPEDVKDLSPGLVHFLQVVAVLFLLVLALSVVLSVLVDDPSPSCETLWDRGEGNAQTPGTDRASWLADCREESS